LELSKKSIYYLIFLQFIINPGCVDQTMVDMWKTKLPLKIQIFLWMLWHDRLQTADQLRKKELGWAAQGMQTLK